MWPSGSTSTIPIQSVEYVEVKEKLNVDLDGRDHYLNIIISNDKAAVLN